MRTELRGRCGRTQDLAPAEPEPPANPLGMRRRREPLGTGDRAGGLLPRGVELALLQSPGGHREAARGRDDIQELVVPPAGLEPSLLLSPEAVAQRAGDRVLGGLGGL